MVKGRLHTREDSGIVLDRDGRWWHDDEPIEHPKILEAFNRGIEPTEDGRYILRFGRDWCYVRVEECAYAVEGLTEEEDRLVLSLSDGTEEPLAPSTLSVGDQGVLRCSVKAGRACARFSRSAQFSLGDRLERDSSGTFLRTGTVRHRVQLPLEE